MKASQKKEFISLTLEGEFDRDRGGRKPEVRRELRRMIGDCVPFTEVAKDDLDTLTTEDAVVIGILMQRLAAIQSDLQTTRMSQSHSGKRRGKVKG